MNCNTTHYRANSSSVPGDPTAAILAGDGETGATIMQVRLALDAGPMINRAVMPIGDDDTTATLTPRIAEAGAAALLDVLPRWAASKVQAVEQDEALATYAPQIDKADALIDWRSDSTDVAWRKVRAYNPWPIAYSYLDGAPMRFIDAVPIADGRTVATPGAIVASEDARAGFGVATADGVLGIVRVQAPGGKVMSAADFVRGRRDIIGKVLTGPGA